MLDSVTTRNILTIIISVGFSAAGQTFLKLGLNNIPSAEKRSGAGVLLAAATQPLCWLGICLFAFSVLLWMIVLSRAQLSWAYPLLGLSYVLVVLSGRIVFGEQLTPSRILGTALVIAGAVFIGRS